MVASSKNKKAKTISSVYDLVQGVAALGVVAIEVAASGVVGASGAAAVPCSGQEQGE